MTTPRELLARYVTQAELSSLYTDRMKIYNVLAYGAKGDGATDDSEAIQAAIDAAEAGGIVYFPAGIYLIGTELSWTADGVSLIGAGKDVTTLRNASGLGANSLIGLTGESDDYIENVHIEGITFRNGTASEASYTAGMDCIVAEYVDGLVIHDCKFTEVQGAFGVTVKSCKDVHVEKCDFYRWTYAGMYILSECDGVWVEDCVFDTAVSTTLTNTYTLAIGTSTTGEGERFAKNVWIQRNKFLNNPRWEGLDCHGGENIWIQDNYIENVKVGIACACTLNAVTTPVAKHIIIEGNTVIQGTGEDGSWGIAINGSGDYTISAEHIRIRDNKVVGFGGTTSTTIATMTVTGARDVTIEGNHVDEYAQTGIGLYVWVRDCVIRNNRISNQRGGIAAATISAISLLNAGNYGIVIENNTVDPDGVDSAPVYFVKGPGAATNALSIQIRNNTVHYVGTSTYGNSTRFPVEKSTIPTGLTQKYGDVVFDDTGKPRWVVATPTVGYGSQVTDVIVTGSVEAGSTTVTDVTASTGTYMWLPEGMNITIAGAGAGGANLNAKVLVNNVTTLTLDTAATTAVTGANITYQTLTFTEIPRLLEGSLTWNVGSLVDGAGETSGNITVTGAALGDFVIVSAPVNMQGLIAYGYVSAANTANIRVQNESGSTVDLAEGTWKVRVIKQ